METLQGKNIKLIKIAVVVEEWLIKQNNINYYQARDSTNKQYILKVFNESSSDLFHAELVGFRLVRSHGKLLQFFDYLETENFQGILLEYTPRFTLKTVMESQPLNDSQILTVIRDVLLGLYHIHSKKLVHNNISLDTIFVTNDFRLKLGGFTHICAEAELSSRSPPGPQHLLAPEQLDSSTSELTLSVDLWSVGCLLYTLLYSQTPFVQEDANSQMRGRYRSSHKQAGEYWKLILKRLFDPVPYTRASIQEIITLIHEPYMPKPITIESIEMYRPTSLFKKSSGSWVKAITAENEEVPDLIYTSKLIGKAWNKPFKIPKFYQSMQQRPLSKASVALKSFVILMKYISLGPKTAVEINMGIITYLDELERCWTFSTRAKSEKGNTEYTIRLVQNLISALKSKIRVIADTKINADWSNLSETTEGHIPGVFNCWDQCIETTKQLMLNSENYKQIKWYLCNLFLEEQQSILLELAALMSKNNTSEYNQNYEACKQKTLNLLQKYNDSFNRGFKRKLFCTEPSLPTNTSIFSISSTEKVKSGTTVSLTSSESPYKRLSVDNSWIINMDEVKLNETIGIGSSCTVYKGSYRHTPVAIKVLKKKSKSSKKEFEREVEAMVKLRHPNLVLFMGAGFDNDLCILTEYCGGDTLFNLLHERKNIDISDKQKLKIAKDTAQGMAFLHSSGIIHRDLKSLNLLISEPVSSASDGIHIKITDFGISRNIGEEMMTGQMGTCHWMAPEVLASEHYGFPADVYSYGIVLWEVYARETPYKGINPAMIPFQVLHNDLRPELSSINNEKIKDLIAMCWTKSQEKRPDFSQILEYLDNTNP